MTQPETAWDTFPYRDSLGELAGDLVFRSADDALVFVTAIGADGGIRTGLFVPGPGRWLEWETQTDCFPVDEPLFSVPAVLGGMLANGNLEYTIFEQHEGELVVYHTITGEKMLSMHAPAGYFEAMTLSSGGEYAAGMYPLSERQYGIDIYDVRNNLQIGSAVLDGAPDDSRWMRVHGGLDHLL